MPAACGITLHKTGQVLYMISSKTSSFLYIFFISEFKRVRL
nr:MAG TPA: hypothetical protein [Caudoviricetes sp.]